MIFIGVFLAVVAFVETILFFYLKSRIKKICAAKLATYLAYNEAEAYRAETERKDIASSEMFREAKALFVRARAENSQLLH